MTADGWTRRGLAAAGLGVMATGATTVDPLSGAALYADVIRYAGFFVSDIWHRRMPTKLGKDRGRFFLQVHYGRRDIAQRILTTEAANQLSEEAIARAETERERRVVGLHPAFFYDG